MKTVVVVVVKLIGTVILRIMVVSVVAPVEELGSVRTAVTGFEVTVLELYALIPYTTPIGTQITTRIDTTTTETKTISIDFLLIRSEFLIVLINFGIGILLLIEL